MSLDLRFRGRISHVLDVRERNECEARWFRHCIVVV